MIVALVVVVDQIQAGNGQRHQSRRVIAGVLVAPAGILVFAGGVLVPTRVFAGGVVGRTVVSAGGVVVGAGRVVLDVLVLVAAPIHAFPARVFRA